jgi:indole-3-glycerol phosphate synthase
MSKLEQLVGAAREDVERRKSQVSVADLRDAVGTLSGSRPFSEALVRDGLSLIAEFKRRSPSSGEIAADASVAEVCGAYERGGAAAISVLTDQRHFGGSLDDLRAARAASSLPILRKDFIVDVYQLYEAAVNGADAVLLIVAALPADDLSLLSEEAEQLDLDCLVEVHDEPELALALELEAEVIGINNRDLGDFTVSLDTTAELITDVPAGKAVVSESGYSHPDQLAELERIGCDAVLIGETLMRSEDPEAAVRALTMDEATGEQLADLATEDRGADS